MHPHSLTHSLTLTPAHLSMRRELGPSRGCGCGGCGGCARRRMCSCCSSCQNLANPSSTHLSSVAMPLRIRPVPGVMTSGFAKQQFVVDTRALETRAHELKCWLVARSFPRSEEPLPSGKKIELR